MIATKPLVETDEDYRELVKLQAKYTDASNAIAKIQQQANSALMSLLREDLTEYARLQKIISESELQMELICRRHPEWFSETRSVKTPFGEAKFVAASHLEPENEELSIELIKAAAAKDESIAADSLIRSKESLNIEALEKLSDAALKRFKINRVSDDNFTAKPAKLNMGKAAKAVEKEVAR